MRVCRRLPTFHFELLFPYLFSFVVASIDPAERATHAFMDVCHYALQRFSGPKVSDFGCLLFDRRLKLLRRWPIRLKMSG
jgi:hypothetical protein